jgi:release factor glutamine methyltransferase
MSARMSGSMVGPMTVGNALQEGRSRLFYAEVDTPLLDATVLLCEALMTSKERLLASLPEPLAEAAYHRYRELLDRRSAGIPVSYIRGRKEFFSLELRVDERVLVPRPDTEILVEEALRLTGRDRSLRRVHDACTGSGCVAIALKHTRPNLEVSASDLESRARDVFEENARRLLATSIPFLLSDLLSGAAGPYDLITANPPYLTDREVDDMIKVGWPEPPRALRGGADGTELLRRLIGQAPGHLARPGWLLLEAAPGQMRTLQGVMADYGFGEIGVAMDLGGRARVIRGSLR